MSYTSHRAPHTPAYCSALLFALPTVRSIREYPGRSAAVQNLRCATPSPCEPLNWREASVGRRMHGALVRWTDEAVWNVHVNTYVRIPHTTPGLS